MFDIGTSFYVKSTGRAVFEIMEEDFIADRGVKNIVVSVGGGFFGVGGICIGVWSVGI